MFILAGIQIFFPEIVFGMSQGWFPYEYRYRIGLVVFLVSEIEVCTGLHG
jgi:hypothetical protein